MKTLIRRTIKNCQQCRIRKSMPLEISVAVLPHKRINISLLFEEIAVDLAGPFKTRDKIEQPDLEEDGNKHNEMKKAGKKRKRKCIDRHAKVKK